jgi:hypothetical protein
MLVDIKLHVKFKLFALWCSVIFFYVYGDYLSYINPGSCETCSLGIRYLVRCRRESC